MLIFSHEDGVMNCYNIDEVVCSFNTNVVPAIQDKKALEGIDRIAKFINAEL